VVTDASVTPARRGANDITVTIAGRGGGSEVASAERLIAAVGVEANSEGLGLVALGVVTERGSIRTTGVGETSVPGIRAIGDVAGAPMLAHKASHEGVLVAEAIAGHRVEPLVRERVPACVYSSPEVASVGLGEAKALAAGYEVRVGRAPFSASGKALALGEPDGLIKTVFDARTGRLLGAHLIGADVTELIHGFVVAIGLETTEIELMATVFPHPTLSESLHESVLAAFGRALHV
jgi:dihydrolipoamide dehydrogenase